MKPENIIRIQDYKKIDNTENTNDYEYHTLRKVKLNKALLKKIENKEIISYFNETDRRKGIKGTLIPSDSKILIKCRLIKNKIIEDENKNNNNCEIEKNQIDDAKYLKKIITRNRNRSQGALKGFYTCDQKNKKILSVLTENFKLKNRNNSDYKDFKISKGLS